MISDQGVFGFYLNFASVMLSPQDSFSDSGMKTKLMRKSNATWLLITDHYTDGTKHAFFVILSVAKDLSAVAVYMQSWHEKESRTDHELLFLHIIRPSATFFREEGKQRK